MSTTRIALAAACLVTSLATAGAQSFNGVSCDDVRALSKSQQNYWAKRLNLSAEQRHLIYVICYEKQLRDHESDRVADVAR